MLIPVKRLMQIFIVANAVSLCGLISFAMLYIGTDLACDKYEAKYETEAAEFERQNKTLLRMTADYYEQKQAKTNR